jgi:hypothetical protein
MRTITTENALLDWLRDQIMLVQPVREMPSAFYNAYADIFEIIKEVGRAYHHLAMASEDE